MNIIIIEDELKTAASLEKIILDLKPDTHIAGKYQSIESSVNALSAAMPDLIFMDIQLADGLCFDIFKSVEVTCPVVFCTAYDEYSLDAFKSNGIDYILKPFSKQDIESALKKVDELKNFFQQKATPDISELISRLEPQNTKTSFLVFKNQKYKTVHIDDIAYFSVRHETTWITCFDKQQFTISQTLEQVANAVSMKQFFRVNRQYLINFKAIKEVEHHFMRKLLVTLSVETPDALLINKEKTSGFLAWMENR